jgi:cell division protein FtsB
MLAHFLESIKERLEKYLSLFLVLLSLIFLLSLARNVIKINTANQNIKEAEGEAAKLSKGNAQLREKLSEVQSEEYVERQLRDKLGLAKEGEIVIVLPDEETLRKFAPREVEEEETLPDPNWRMWARLFGF